MDVEDEEVEQERTNSKGVNRKTTPQSRKRKSGGGTGDATSAAASASKVL